MISPDKITPLTAQERESLTLRAKQLVGSDGLAGARQWMFMAADYFPADINLSLDFAKILEAHSHGREAVDLLCTICKSHPERLDVYELLGRRLRSFHPRVNATASAPSYSSDDGDDGNFVTVFGTSYVRSFASGTRFLPLLVGPGRSMSFITPECADVTRRLTLNNIARVDPRSLVLLVYGNGDANNHFRNDFGTWSAVESGQLPNHESVIHAAARRYFELVDEIRSQYPLKLALFCAVPMLDVKVNRLVKLFNEDLRAYCADRGLPLLDLTDQLEDPSTGCLRKEFCSAEDNPHIGHELVPLVERGLEKLGLLPQTTHPFEWDYMFRFSIDPKVETRIWSEPHIGSGNVVHSKKIMFTQIVERSANVLLGHLGVAEQAKVLLLNGKEGFLSLEIPQALASHIVSTEVNNTKNIMARRIARLLGRSDIKFETVTSIHEAVEAAADCDYAMMVVHEDDDAADCLATLGALMYKVRRRIFVLTSLDWDASRKPLDLYKKVEAIQMSNRLVTGYWAKARLLALTP